MNSLKIVSSRVIGTPTPSPARSRSASYRDLSKAAAARPLLQTRKTDGSSEYSEKVQSLADEQALEESDKAEADDAEVSDEKTPLLRSADEPKPFDAPKTSRWPSIPKSIFDALVESLKWVLSSVAVPGIYIVSCFYDESGGLSPLSPIRRVGKLFSRRKGRTSPAYKTESLGEPKGNSKRTSRRRKGSDSSTSKKPSILESRSSSSLSSQSEKSQTEDSESPAKNTRSKTSDPASQGEEGAQKRRSIRIKVSSSDTQKSKRGKTSQYGTSDSDADSTKQAVSPSSLKSPTASQTSRSRITRYPRAPAPPRPLIPRKQPSYSIPSPIQPHLAQKTLILDLDETLIHSLAKGGRMSTGHMVEVKLNTPVGLGPSVMLAPQHPILYYVHKRPHCDEFLRKVSQWYRLVIFTASVQEYADPVIDWLETDRKYFSGRFYRQHCTFRQGNYIKDLSTVEPDLSKVMIIDNSPTSYIFHEDNALPIEGWINDPTDNDLLHLIPLLEALQYTTDVRALLALRMGEAADGVVANSW